MLSPQTSRCRPSSHTSPRTDTGSGSGSGHVVRIGEAGAPVGEQFGELLVREADQAEIGAHRLEVGQFNLQQFHVPAGVQRELVVGDDIGALLRLAPAARDHHRNLSQAQLTRRQHPAMAGDQRAALVDQHRRPSSPIRG